MSDTEIESSDYEIDALYDEEEELKHCPIAGYENYILYSNGTVFSLRKGKYLKMLEGRVGYHYVDLYSKTDHKKRDIHRLVAEHFIPNPYHKKYVDHIDGNITNNDFKNLRWATAKENGQNRKMSDRNTSGHKNVYWDSQKRKWKVAFRIDDRTKHCGHFDDLDDAATFASQKRKELFGEFARDE